MAKKSGARKPSQELSCGFAIGTTDETRAEENLKDRIGPYASAPEKREEWFDAGYIDESGEITEKGWEQLNKDCLKLERNSMKWLRDTFESARDEGHSGDFDELVGTVWFNPKDKNQRELIELASPGNERIDMTDSSYGDLADSVFDGVSDFGQWVLDGQINFFDVPDLSEYESNGSARRNPEGAFNKGVDTWFGDVSDHPQGEVLERLSHSIPTKINFEKFRDAASKLRASWAPALNRFLAEMERGRFKDEFRYFAHKSGNMHQSSQVGELFSLFRQAYHYNDE